jgi:hypothetical protein
MYHEEEEKNAFILLVEKLAGERPLKGLTCQWMDNVKMDLGVIL